MPNYLDDQGNTISDPVSDAKGFLSGTSYLDDNGDPIAEPVAAKPKSTFDKIKEFGDKPVTDYLPEGYRPSDIISKITEPLMRYGESENGLGHTAALYGGAYLDELAKVASSMTSPTNIGLTALTGASGTADAAGLTKVAQALETPGRIAAGTMMYHGGSKALDSSADPSDRIGGVAEALIGALGVRSGVKEVPNAEVPKVEPDIPIVKTDPTVESPIVKEKPSTDLPVADPIIFKGKLSLKDWPEDTSLKNYLDENGESIPAEVVQAQPTAKYSSFQEDDTHPEGGFHLYDIQGGPSDKSSVSAETLGKMGIEVPPTPVTSQIPPEVKTVLDANNIDSSKMDTTTAVNAARDVKGLDPVDRLKSALQSSADVKSQQDVLNSQERSRRAGMISGVETPGVEGLKQKAALLKGEFSKIPIKSQLTPEDVHGLIGNINSSDLLPFQKLNAGMALTKLGSGKAVNNYEAKLLSKVFGNDMEELIHLHGGLGAFGVDRKLFNEVVNLPKTMMATADLSAPLRQGLPLIATKEYWKSFASMLRNESDFKSFQEGLTERPNYDIGHEAGLYLADTKNITGREEQFLSGLVDKVPLLGSAKKASERAYTGFLNKLRADTFDHLLKNMEDMGVELRDATGKPTKPVADLADFVNNSTGRGSLDLAKVAGVQRNPGSSFGNLEKVATELNAGIFSPRLLSSRLTMLNLAYYAKLDPFVQKQALKSLFSVAGAGLLTTSLLKKAGATVNSDPFNSDFGKAKIGNTRLDPFAGFQQPVVAAARFIRGKETSVNGKEYDLNTSKFPNPTRGSVIGNFARSKESPIAQFIDDLMQGDQAFKPSGLGAKISNNDISARAINLVTPMLVNDMIDLKKENPDLLPGITLAMLATFGDSLQTMNPAKPKSAFRFNLGVGKP